MLDIKEYRKHFLEIKPEEKNSVVFNHIVASVEDEENKDMRALYYAVGSHNNDGGDGHYNPSLNGVVKELSAKFPILTFHFRWENEQDKKDKGKYTYRAGVAIKEVGVF